MADEDKTEEPTHKKLEDARDQGQIVRSPDVGAAGGLAVMTICLIFAGSIAGDHLLKLFDIINERAWYAATAVQINELAYDLLAEGLWMALPFVLASTVIGFLVAMAQADGLQITLEPIVPNFEKLNPAEGLKRLFSIRSFIDLAKMTFKAILLGSVITVIILDLLPLLLGTSQQQPLSLVAVAWSAITKLFLASTIVFILIGPVDWGLQRWLFMRDQRMTKHEVKREHKEMEGDPLIKKKRREIALEMVNGPPPKRVPNASVVVTNPTHYAVALQYVPGDTPVPLIIAKGQGPEAAQIRELASLHGIPVVGNPPLARALYRYPLDEPIPEELFEAVATVLRWVNLLKSTGAARARTPPPRPPAGEH